MHISEAHRQADNAPSSLKTSPESHPDRKRAIQEKNSRCQKVPRAAECMSGRTRTDCLVREVGFEPTNPYGTGASGLRFHDP